MAKDKMEGTVRAWREKKVRMVDEVKKAGKWKQFVIARTEAHMEGVSVQEAYYLAYSIAMGHGFWDAPPAEPTPFAWGADESDTQN